MKQTTLRSKDVSQMTPVIAAFKQQLGDNLVAIVLFGSRARGDAKETSDWDILLIARHLPVKLFQRHLYLKKIVPDAWRGQVAIIAKTPEEFEAHLPSLYLDIALDGIILYDTAEYMADRLSRLQSLIQAEGLEREQLERDMVWHWQKSPGFNWSLEWESVP
jgi:predicted nucleotidyltransferase